MKYVSDSDRPLYTRLSSFVRTLDPWRVRIAKCMPESKFSPPATDEDLAALRQALGHDIPADLRQLLLESNGVETPYSTLIYSTSRIAEVNRDFRNNEGLKDRMPFDHLLFFGTVSDGDEFAFPINCNGSFNDAVFVWSHESDCREEYAMFLADYIAKYTVELYTPYMQHRAPQ